MQTATQIYEDLIKRIRRRIYAETEITFDMATGWQRKWLHGKLIAMKQVRTVLLLPAPKKGTE
jgi:hypothetical protein